MLIIYKKGWKHRGPSFDFPSCVCKSQEFITDVGIVLYLNSMMNNKNQASISKTKLYHYLLKVKKK